MDVSALYTNIPHDEGIAACKKILAANDFSRPFISDFTSIVEFILTHNHFEFNGQHFLQTSGTAMGSRMAPSYAIIFMADLEHKMLAGYPLKPLHYFRYIDDIFFLWPHGLHSLNNFFSFCNNFHSSIKFTFDYSDTEIPFLDVLVKLGNSAIATTLFCKPTDTHGYLNFFSSHHISVKRSIVFSQCIRIRRICSSQSEYDKHICNLVGYFLNNSYPLPIIKEGIRKASIYPRDRLLTYKPKVKTSRIPLVFDYSPKTERLHKVIRSDYSILKSDPSLSELFDDPPLTARRQPPSLKTLLTSSRLIGARNIGNTKCSKPRCQVCHFIVTDKTFTPPGTKCLIRPPPLHCDTPNVVYLLFCNLCDKGNYVGQTSNKFRFRFNNHKKTVQDKSVNFPVAKHFCGEPNHSISNLKCILLGTNYKSVNERLKSESKWVVKLSTHTRGLNKDLGILSDFLFVINNPPLAAKVN